MRKCVEGHFLDKHVSTSKREESIACRGKEVVLVDGSPHWGQWVWNVKKQEKGTWLLSHP